MIYILIFLGILSAFLLADRRYLLKKIKGEKLFQKWSTQYTYELTKNRESLLTDKQWSELHKMDDKTTDKFENKIQPPNVPTIYY